MGSRSIADLLVYEAFIGWGGVIPGAAGLLFRSKLWPGRLSRCGRGCVWGRNVVLRHPGKMWFGDRVLVDDSCFFDAKGCSPGEFQIGDDVLISRNCTISGKDGPLRLGHRVNIGPDCVLFAPRSLEIGDDSMLASGCRIGGGQYDIRGPIDVPISRQALPRQGVVIEPDCWLGAGAVVIDGVRIGRGSVVGAGAVVTRNLEPYSIAVGVPARVIGQRSGEVDPVARLHTSPGAEH